MKSWIFSIAAALLLAPAAQAQPLTAREALRAVMPYAIEVIEELEHERGHRFAEGELPAVLNSADFERRLGERVKDDPVFAPCRIEQCMSA